MSVRPRRFKKTGLRKNSKGKSTKGLKIKNKNFRKKSSSILFQIEVNIYFNHILEKNTSLILFEDIFLFFNFQKSTENKWETVIKERQNELPSSILLLNRKSAVIFKRFRDSSKCFVCQNKEADGCFIHGQISHQVCCYECAKKIFKAGKSCIVCNRTIAKVTRNIVA